MKILVIDSELRTRRLLRTCLERNGYEVVEAATGSEGIDETLRTRPAAVLLDLELPDIDGLIVLKRLREWGQVPVLVVSASAQEEDKIIALNDGENDDLSGSFRVGELLAGIQVPPRPASPAVEEPLNFRCGDLEVDPIARMVLIGGQKVELNSTEYSLLALFIKHAGKVLTHGHLLREIWGTTDPAKLGRLRVHMTQLREKLQPHSAESDLFFARTGIGYRLVLREKSFACR